MKTSILYIFLLSVLYACDSHSLLPPKQQLDQQIAQLNDYSLLSGRLNDQLCEEIETHAPNVKCSCQNNAADDNTHIFRQQEKNQQQQSGSEQSPRHNFSQKCPDR